MRLIHGILHPMTGPMVEDGYLTLKEGIIQDLGPMDRMPVDEEPLLDLQGLHVYPGLIDAHCHLGMWEEGLDFEGDDGNEDTDPATPQLRAIDGVNPMDAAFAETLRAGITTVVTGPGSANPIGGQLCALKTWGVCVDDMILKAPVGMKFALGENPKNTYHDKSQAPTTRMATAAIIREQLKKAQRYQEDQQRAREDEDCDAPEYDPKCEALIPVLQGKLKAHFHAHRADDMFTALRLAREFHLDLVLVHGTEGHLVSQRLAQTGVPVITGPLISTRPKPELRNASYTNPGVLAKAGVPTVICTDHPEIPCNFLTVCAAVAVREGMPWGQAMQAITIQAAAICGIQDRVGSLEVGKDGDLAIFRGDPLTASEKPVMVFVNGQQVV